MKLSVIIPVFGRTPNLAECRAALFRQTFRDFNVIECAPAADGSQNAGAARNVGLDRATGEWIAFVDADDLPMPEMLATAVAAGESAGADIVVFNAVEFDDVTGWRTSLPLKLHTKSDAERFTSFGNCVWNKLFRADYLRRNGIRFQEQKRSNDLAFVIETLARTDRIAVIDEVLYEYRINNPSSLQASKLSDSIDYAAAALAECRRRIESAGLTARFSEALKHLTADIADNNRRRLCSRILHSIRNRGFLNFLKHSIGRMARRFA